MLWSVFTSVYWSFITAPKVSPATSDNGLSGQDGQVRVRTWPYTTYCALCFILDSQYGDVMCSDVYSIDVMCCDVCSCDVMCSDVYSSDVMCSDVYSSDVMCSDVYSNV